jgi:hypothetical protein
LPCGISEREMATGRRQKSDIRNRIKEKGAS